VRMSSQRHADTEEAICSRIQGPSESIFSQRHGVFPVKGAEGVTHDCVANCKKEGP
jgi:hypothetical protein